MNRTQPEVGNHCCSNDDFARMTHGLRHECGLIGGVLGEHAGEWLSASHKPGFTLGRFFLNFLKGVEHRGEDASGIAWTIPGELSIKVQKGLKTPTEVFTPEVVASISESHPTVFSGHCRYSTIGSENAEAGIQPLRGKIRLSDEVTIPFAVSHNGEISNYEALKVKFASYIGAECASDSELIARIFEFNAYCDPDKSFLELVRDTVQHLEGAYNLVFQFHDRIIIARDRAAMRPFESLLLPGNKGVLFASESSAFNRVLLKGQRQQCDSLVIDAGEIVEFNINGSIESCFDPRPLMSQGLCSLEPSYIMRHNSIYGRNNLKYFREALGAALYSLFPVTDSSIVIPIPNSGLDAAHGFYHEGIRSHAEIQLLKVLRSQHKRRSFISANTEERIEKIGSKLFIDKELARRIEGQNVILIDDSIVRGNTARILVDAIRKYNPQSITILSAHPLIVNPCWFGVDIKKPDDFVLRMFCTEEGVDYEGMAFYLHADNVGFISVDAYERVDRRFRGQFADLCFGCSTGEYPYPPPATDTDIISLIDLAERKNC